MEKSGFEPTCAGLRSPCSGPLPIYFPCRERNDRLGFSKRWCDSFFAIALMLVSHLCGCRLLTPSRQWARPLVKALWAGKGFWSRLFFREKGPGFQSSELWSPLPFPPGAQSQGLCFLLSSSASCSSIAAPLVGPLCTG